MNIQSPPHGQAALPARPLAPAKREPAWLAVLMRPAVLLAVLYAIAICFERLIEVDIFKPYRIIGAALLVAALAQGRLVVDGVARAVLLFILIGVVLGLSNILLNDMPAAGLLGDSLLWLFNLASYVAIASLMRHRREVMLVLVVHSIAMVFASYDILTHSQQVLVEEGASTRVSGDFKNPAHACLSMMMATLVIIGLVRKGLLRGHGLAWRALVVGAILALIGFQIYVSSLTGSRAGAAVFIIGIFAYLMVAGWRRLALWLAGVAIAGALLLTQFDAWPGESSSNILIERMEHKGTDTTRLYLWRSGMDAYIDSYGLGLGLAQYRSVHRQYFERYALRGDERMSDHDLSLHSDFISALVEFGIIGLLVFITLCRRIWRFAHGIVNPEIRALAIALVWAAAVMALSHAVLPYFGLWFYLALLSSWWRIEAAERGAGVAPSRAMAR
jgi:O-antigen ligase